MTPNEYIESVKRSESTKFYIPSYARRLLHGAIGCSTESGELLDALKKCIFYEKPVDFTNVKEEIGDLLWYIAIILDEMGSSFDEVMKINISKLYSRYPERFTSDNAIHRNLPLERMIMEIVNENSKEAKAKS